MGQLINLQEVMPTKSNIDLVANTLTSGVEAGSISAAEFAVKVKFLRDVLDKALKDTNDALCREVNGSKDFTCLGAKIEPAETGTKYEYSQDGTWAQLKAEIKPLEDKLKAQEESIKIATKLGKSIMDEETGELLARPVVKTSTSSVKITLSK